VLALNAFRTAFAGITVWIVILAIGWADRILVVPFSALGGLLASVVMGMALGDSFHIRAMNAIGVARAMPISSSYPLLTTLLAVTWLGEPVTLANASGVIVIVAGVYLVASPPRRIEGVALTDPAVVRKGVLMAMAASVCWAGSTIVIKPALDLTDPMIANGIRLPAAFVLLWLLSAQSGRLIPTPWSFGRRPALILAASGGLSGFSGGFWLYAVREAGAAKAAALSSTAPIFAAPLAVLLLGERLSPRVGVGTLLTVVGIWLVL